MLALRDVTYQRLSAFALHAAPLLVVIGALSFQQKARIINII